MVSSRGDWMLEEKLTHSIIGSFYFVYNTLGFGFLEFIYGLALEKELTRRGHKVAREVLVPVHWQGEILAYQRLDMIVDDRVVVELKATEKLHPKAPRQVFNYLRACNLEGDSLLVRPSSELNGCGE